MKKLLILGLSLASFLAACSVLPIPTPTPTSTKNNLLEGYIAPQNPFTAAFNDSTNTRAPVFISQIQTMQDENDTTKFSLNVGGDMPSPCHQIRASVSPPDPEGKIDVVLYSIVDPNTPCAQVLASFQVSIPLGSFPTGHYVIALNGEVIDEFNAW
jgi:hypothetical protein